MINFGVKNQIRPRRRKIHFTDADILVADTTGATLLAFPPAIDRSLVITGIQIAVNIVQPYGNVDATNPYMLFLDDFYQSAFIEDIDTSNIAAFSGLFTIVGNNRLNVPVANSYIDNSATFDEVGPEGASGFGFGVFLIFSNGGADLNGGDPGNYMDVFLSFNIVNM